MIGQSHIKISEKQMSSLMDAFPSMPVGYVLLPPAGYECTRKKLKMQSREKVGRNWNNFSLSIFPLFCL